MMRLNVARRKKSRRGLKGAVFPLVHRNSLRINQSRIVMSRGLLNFNKMGRSSRRVQGAQNMSMSIVLRFAFVASATVLLAGCPGIGSGGDIMPALKQLPAETQVLLAKSGMKQDSPIFVRIFKEESQLEVWKAKDDGRYYHFKTYPICSWSGELGPKVQAGDKQAPEGFYTVTPGQMNPNSQFHLAFNVGFPNSYDKVNGRTGSALMVHGDCRSAGCFAMTDALIEEIYALARESFRGGQTQFHVHAFPFRMSEENMKRYRNHKWYAFWKTLKQGYDDFELSRVPPKVAVCSRQYLVNADFLGHDAKPEPSENCPAYRKAPITPFNPFDGQLMAKAQPVAQPAAVETSRVAAYATPSPVSSIREPAAPVTASRPAPPTALSSQPATVAAQPTKIARAAPSPSQQTHDAEQRPVSLAGAVAMQPQPVQPPSTQPVQPVSATFTPSPAVEPAPQEAAEKTEVTRGLHNVMESGKGDMMMPAR
jgi:murein L,D-transpeptidase YafK